MALLDTVLVISIMLFLGLVFWSRFMGQTMVETFREIKEIFAEIVTGE